MQHAAYSVLTVLAPGGVAVLSLTGNGAADLLSRICVSRDGHHTPDLLTRPLPLVKIVDNDETIDDAIIVRLDSPPEQEFELCLHGGVRIVQRVVMLLERHGARRAAPSPINTPAARIDALLPSATTRRMARWLLAQRLLLPQFLDRLHGRAQPPVTPIEKAAFDIRSDTAARLVAGMHVAIVGPPNAGKSTLANALIGRNRVIVSDLPGTTRDWVEEQAVVDDWPIRLTDTAGLRKTQDELEAASIQRGWQVARQADLVLLVSDIRESLAQPIADRAALPRAILVLNKSDLLQPSPPCDDQPASEAMVVSALTGAGMAQLERRIACCLGLDALREDAAAMPWRE